ncbi:protein FAM166B-like isoform X2 [Belonocnema kinseyi]|uniref:protein FAM166B-like isoform X2 n=1 Tax=Belonocnema kinseyi TaxID=2817044 RepID=UPI00143D82E2|nr:protein FAM166B-like isoform X2 [Belonocnema kinseyi]
MGFDPVTEEQRKQFFRQGYGSHLPGYTGHCPTLKFRVGKRFGVCTEEIIKKKILKMGPYRPNGITELKAIPQTKDIRRDWKNDSHFYQPAPYILGYTGYIPGFNDKYGLPFMRAVEEGAKDWNETQNKIRVRRDSLRAHAERRDPRNLLSRVRQDNVHVEKDHGHRKEKNFFDQHVSSERPPIVGYTGHIPGAKGEVSLSKGYRQAAKKGLELLQKEREERFSRIQSTNAIQRVLDATYIDDTGHTRA